MHTRDDDYEDDSYVDEICDDDEIYFDYSHIYDYMGLNGKQRPEPWTPRDDMVIRDCYLEGQSLHEIAHAIGRSPRVTRDHMLSLGYVLDFWSIDEDEE